LNRELTPAQHALIRRQLALIPVYIWLVYSWTHLLVRIPGEEPLRDFSHFYVQGLIALRHDAPALYDINLMADIGQSVLPGGHRAMYPPVYGPQVSLFFSPMALLSYVAARNAWIVLSLCVYAACMYAIWKACPRLHAHPGLVTLLLIAAPALHYVLGFVQISALALVCVTAGFFALRANRLFWAGVALGMLAYKPPLCLAIGFVFLFAGEWTMIAGAITAAAVQLAIGTLYWGPSILPPYILSLTRVPDVAQGMEPYKFHMHSWRAFFDLLGFSARLSLAAYLLASASTAVVALLAWRSRGPLALRYAVLLIAAVLVDPHLYAYDLVVLVPAYLLLWNWVLEEPHRRVGDVVPWIPFARARDWSFNHTFVWLLYVCYFAPLFATLADVAGLQPSVLIVFFLEVVLFDALYRREHERIGRWAPT
jgi:alpha-1,2-mannosyltransferase